MNDQSGITLTELLVVVGLASIVTVTTIVFSAPLLVRETVRSALHDAQAAVQLAKIEATSRNRACRFVVDTDQRTWSVWDTQGTDPRDDDLQLFRRSIPEAVAFGRPDAGAAVTLDQIGTSAAFEAVVTSTGIVSDGTGDVCLAGGDGFGRLSVHAAGGVQLQRWDGSNWKPGG